MRFMKYIESILTSALFWLVRLYSALIEMILVILLYNFL